MAMSNSQHENNPPIYLRIILAGLATWGTAVGLLTLSDYLQPVFPVLLILMPLSMVLGIVCYYEKQKWPLFDRYFENGIVFSGLVFFGSILLIISQQFFDSGTKKGAIASFIAFYWPSSENEPSSSGVIAHDLDNPEAARAYIMSSGYTVDNEGFIKSLYEDDSATHYFKALNINGDTLSLQFALTLFPVSSKEYERLARFMNNSNYDHYSKAVMKSIIEFLQEPESTHDIKKIYEITCSSSRQDFIAKFMRRSLNSACKDDGSFLFDVVDFAKDALSPLDGKSNRRWWLMNATSQIKYAPIAVKSKSLKKKQISYQELLLMYKNNSTPIKQYFKAEGYISVLRHPSGFISIDIFDPSTKRWSMWFSYSGENIENSQCWIDLPDTFDNGAFSGTIVPKCRARLTLFKARSEDQLRVLAVENLVTAK